MIFNVFMERANYVIIILEADVWQVRHDKLRKRVSLKNNNLLR